MENKNGNKQEENVVNQSNHGCGPYFEIVIKLIFHIKFYNNK